MALSSDPPHTQICSKLPTLQLETGWLRTIATNRERRPRSKEVRFCIGTCCGPYRPSLKRPITASMFRTGRHYGPLRVQAAGEVDLSSRKYTLYAPRKIKTVVVGAGGTPWPKPRACPSGYVTEGCWDTVCTLCIPCSSFLGGPRHGPLMLLFLETIRDSFVASRTCMGIVSRISTECVGMRSGTCAQTFFWGCCGNVPRPQRYVK